MLKICFLIANDKPVPPVEGGAVETLVQSLIDENEKLGKYEFTIFTILAKGVDYSKYKHTRFVALPQILVPLSKPYWKLTGLVRRLFHKELLAPLPKIGEYFFLKGHAGEFDLIVEETNLRAIEKCKESVPADKVLYHLHCEGSPTPDNDRLFGYLMPISGYIGETWQTGTGRRADTIFILKNCIDVSKFQKQLSDTEIAALREKYSIKQEDTVALYIGRIVEEKGVLELLEAVKALNDKSLVLFLIGSANFAQKTATAYEKQVGAMLKKMQTRVFWLGYVDNRELYRYQAVSDFAIVPSIYNEPAGLVVLEAQAAGLPVIASEMGGIPEFLCKDAGMLVRHDNHYIQSLAEAIGSMLERKPEFPMMGDRGRQFVAQFDQREYYRNFAEIVDRIISAGKRKEN